ncbi:MAG: fibronectin type III domain-containing protein [Bacteroidales bacterium]|nr:fibronectin type III domain-containing protein [Bacteroidales bacterium]
MRTIWINSLLALLILVSCGDKENADPVPSAPATPTGLVLHSATKTSLTFQWDAVSGASAYEWRLLEDGTQKFTNLVDTPDAVVESLSPGTTYSFSVRSIMDGLKSSWSSSVTATTERDTEYYAQFAIPAVEEDGVARAFPGAEGGGMYTTGGRGGKVLHVTNLNDSGDGSLRAAINTKGARIIVFDVAGTIELTKQLKVEDGYGDVTIAGQTAPGDGICIKNYSFVVNADNVIIRFLRFRLGDEGPDAGDSEDCIWGRYRKDIILDHCSMSWSIDETASFYGNVNMTMQWCLIAESMNKSKHSKSTHGYGGIWGGKDASFHHNLLAHHQNRTPRFDHQNLYEENGKSLDIYRGNVDYRNSVNYDWGASNACYGGEGGHFNLVNNYIKGLADKKKYYIEADGGYTKTVKEGDKDVKKYYPYEWAYLYFAGNYNNDYPSGDASYPDGVYWKKAYEDYSLSHEGHVSATPFAIKGKDGKAAYTSTHSASAAKNAVVKWAGASLARDAVDTRISADVDAGTGAIINDIADVKAKYGKAWPEYGASKEQIAQATDTDRDGMPDAFETQFGLNPSSAADGNVISLDKNGRYTNLEMYLHYLVKDIVTGQNQGTTYEKL